MTTTSKPEPQKVNFPIKGWAKKNAEVILQKMQTDKVTDSLSLYWPKLKNMFTHGYVAGTEAGFRVGFDLASRLFGKGQKPQEALDESKEVQEPQTDPKQMELDIQ